MTESDFITISRRIATAMIDQGARAHLSPDELSNLACASLVEVLGQQLGPFGAIDRLRATADVMAAQMESITLTH
jgi:hypothetical protein